MFGYREYSRQHARVARSCRHSQEEKIGAFAAVADVVLAASVDRVPSGSLPGPALVELPGGTTAVQPPAGVDPVAQRRHRWQRTGHCLSQQIWRTRRCIAAGVAPGLLSSAHPASESCDE